MTKKREYRGGYEEPTLDEIVSQALLVAKEVFQAEISDYGHDPAYCDIRFTTWIKDESFEQRLRRFEIEDECK